MNHPTTITVLAREALVPGATWRTTDYAALDDATRAMSEITVPTMFRLVTTEGAPALAVAAWRGGMMVPLAMPPWRFSQEAAAWSMKYDWFAAWDNATDPAWMLSALFDESPHDALRAAAELLRRTPPTNRRAAAALDTCGAWLAGRTSTQRMKRAHADVMAVSRKTLDGLRRHAPSQHQLFPSAAPTGAWLETLFDAFGTMNESRDSVATTAVGMLAAMCRQHSSDLAAKGDATAALESHEVPLSPDGLPLSMEYPTGIMLPTLVEQMLRAASLADRDAHGDGTDETRSADLVRALRETVTDDALTRALYTAAKERAVTDTIHEFFEGLTERVTDDPNAA